MHTSTTAQDGDDERINRKGSSTMKEFQPRIIPNVMK